MRYLIASFVAISILGGLGILAQTKTPPSKLVFQAKMGNVKYDHAAHLTRAKGNCKVCHDVLFKQSAQAPLNFKPGMHKPAEAAKTSCCPELHGAPQHAATTEESGPTSSSLLLLWLPDRKHLIRSHIPQRLPHAARPDQPGGPPARAVQPERSTPRPRSSCPRKERRRPKSDGLE